MSKQKIPADIRYALYHGYNQKCAICDEYIEKSILMQVDHIIAESNINPKNKSNKEKIFKDYDLPNDFDLQSLSNLQPLCLDCNNTKRHHKPLKKPTSYQLLKAKNKSKIVTELRKKFNNKKRKDIEEAEVLEAFQNGLNPYELIEQFENVEQSFSERLEVTQNGHESIFIKNKNVRLFGYFLNISEFSSNGSCLIQLRSHYIRATDITFNHNEIIDIFYEGFGTPIEYGMRKYIKHYLKDYDEYAVQLGNVRVYLTSEIVNDFCEIIDIFVSKYVEILVSDQYLMECEDYLPVNRNLKEYNLVSIEPWLWLVIQQFATNNEIGCDKNSFIKYSFELFPNYMLKIYNTKTKCPICFLKIQYIQKTYKQSELQINLNWVFLDNSYFVLKENRNEYLTAHESGKWITNELIPYILYEESKTYKYSNWRILRQIFSKKPKHSSLEYYRMIVKANVKLNNNFLIDTYHVQNYNDLSSILYNLANHFKEVKNICIDIKLINEFTTYLQTKLNQSSDNLDYYRLYALEEIQNDIMKMNRKINIRDSAKCIINGWMFYELLNCCIDLICLIESAGSNNKIQQLLKGLSPIIDIYNKNKIIYKLRNI